MIPASTALSITLSVLSSTDEDNTDRFLQFTTHQTRAAYISDDPEYRENITALVRIAVEALLDAVEG